jgi:3-hydroxy-9,10-secoandrosta-1,3,5(10)-triene-9,17-dione monooxygenase
MYGGRGLTIFTLTLAGVVVGGGYNALDEYAEWVKTKQTYLPPFQPRIDDPDFQRWYGAAFVKVQTAEAAMLRCAEEHMELCRAAAAGERVYTFAEDARLAAIAREAIVQVWEAVEEHLHRTIGSSAAKAAQRFERVFRDLAMTAGHRNTSFRDSFWRQVGAMQLGLHVPGPGGT